MSHDLVVVVDAPMLKLALWQLEPSESRITENERKWKYVLIFQKSNVLLCWPVLVPQMTGDPQAPGEVMENWSKIQNYYNWVHSLLTVFENYRKRSHSILGAKRATFTYHLTMPKMANLASFWKPEVYSQTLLPNRSILIGQKMAENAKNWNIQMRHFW